MKNFVSIQNLNKIYPSTFKALDNLSLDIEKGEIFALLGPNGAGKSTLINIICGIVSKTSGKVLINNHDNVKDFRKTRSMIGVVPQELSLEIFETVWDNVCYSRGLYGKSNNFKYIEELLKELSLWDKKNSLLRELSGGMKRRVLIAKALSHEPSVLFLDEPSASVDVELRKDMWDIIKELKQEGVTIILTTHYIEEAEMIADRIGIINNGDLLLVEEKQSLIKRMSVKTLKVNLKKLIKKIPPELKDYNLKLDDEGSSFLYNYQTGTKKTGITALLSDMKKIDIELQDIQTKETSLEDIFVKIIKE